MTELIFAVPTLTIGGKTHPIAKLSGIAKTQMTNLQIIEAEIQRLQQQLGIAQLTRASLLATLQNEVSKLG